MEKHRVDVYHNRMCGRFALGIPKKRLEELFGPSMPDAYEECYNVAPGRECVTVTAVGGRMLKWGLVPHWAKDPAMGARLINARSETVFDKPAFRDAVRTGRCLVPAQAFYEWKQDGSVRTPYAVGLRDTDVFALAGVSAHWQDRTTGEVVDSFAVLTCPPNTLMKDIHDRMPVILPPDAWSDWLDPAVTAPDLLSAAMRPSPPNEMRAWPVSPAVNSPANQGEHLLNPIPVRTEKQGSLF